MLYEIKKENDRDNNCISFLYENAYNECVSWVCFSEKYDFLLIANETIHYPIKNKSEFSINKNERYFIINPNKIWIWMII